MQKLVSRVKPMADLGAGPAAQIEVAQIESVNGGAISGRRGGVKSGHVGGDNYRQAIPGRFRQSLGRRSARLTSPSLCDGAFSIA